MRWRDDEKDEPVENADGERDVAEQSPPVCSIEALHGLLSVVALEQQGLRHVLRGCPRSGR